LYAFDAAYHFWRATNVFGAAFAIAISSVRPSVCLSISHISDQRQNGLKYRNTVCTTRQAGARRLVWYREWRYELTVPDLKPVMRRFGTNYELNSGNSTVTSEEEWFIWYCSQSLD